MAYSFERTTVRIDTATPFWSWSDEITEHVEVTYVATGKLIEHSVIVENDFILKKKYIFKDKESYDEFNNDPIMSPLWPERNKYNTDNNIISVRTEL